MKTPEKTQQQVREKLLKRVIDNTEDWYSAEIKKSNTEFLAWLESKVK